MNLLTRLFSEEEGQGLTEYALILTLVAVALVSALGFFKEKLTVAYESFNF